MRHDEFWEILLKPDLSVLSKVYFLIFFNEKELTLSRISPRNIYLNLFGGAHFNWRSLKACNIAKKICLAMFEQLYFDEVTVYLDFRYCVCFEQEVRRFTLKRVRYIIIIYSYSNSTLVKSVINPGQKKIKKYFKLRKIL